MKLLDKYEEIKKCKKEVEKKQGELVLKESIGDIVSDILKGEEYCYSLSKKIFEEIGVKYKVESSMFCFKKYYCKITKTLVKKVEEYLESGNKNE